MLKGDLCTASWVLRGSAGSVLLDSRLGSPARSCSGCFTQACGRDQGVSAAMKRPGLVETRGEVANGLEHAEAGGGLPCGHWAEVGSTPADAASGCSHPVPPDHWLCAIVAPGRRRWSVQSMLLNVGVGGCPQYSILTLPASPSLAALRSACVKMLVETLAK